jgi:hypothetical protein
MSSPRFTALLLLLVSSCSAPLDPMPTPSDVPPPVDEIAPPEAEAVARHEPLAQIPVEQTAPVDAPHVVARAPVPAPVQPTAAPEPGEPRELSYPAAIGADSLPAITAAWMEAARFDAAASLVPLDQGVLSRVGGVTHELVDGRWVARPEVDAHSPRALRYAGQIEGRWADNAWRVSAQEHDGERESFTVLQFLRWRGNHRWVSQKIPESFDGGGERQYEDMGTALVRPGARGGMLLADEDHAGDFELRIVRIAGGAQSPASQPLPEDAQAVDLFETPGGQIFVFSETYADDRFVVQRSCGGDNDRECVIRNSVALPATPDRRWNVEHLVSRGRRSATFVVRERGGVGDEDADYWLHHESGGFRLEATPGAASITQLVAADGGGVWAVAGSEGADDDLLYRSDEGQWRRVERPAGLRAEPHVVLAQQGGHIWISGTASCTALYRTPADPLVVATRSVDASAATLRTGAP